MKVLPVIICGGAGTRLFKESKENLPKQFIDFGGWTMFQKTLERISSNLFLPPIISTNIKYLDLVKKHLKKNKINKYQIILEPSKRNTAPAILSPCLLPNIASNQVILYLPSDQLIEEKTKFNQEIKKNLKKIFYKDIFVFGIKPNEPSDQFGYFFRKKNSIEVSKFTEKPSTNKAREIIKKGALWNAGIFMSTKENIIYHFMNEQKQLFKHCLLSVQNSRKKSNNIFLESRSYNKIKSISFDYAILEKIKNIKSIKLNINWSDLGNWKSLLNFYNTNKKKYFTKANLFKRPWGTYRNLFRGKNFLIKELIVNSKGCLSLQKHKYREEQWYITEGSPEITLNKKILKPKIKELIHIPRGSIHRIHNRLKKPVKIIEAQLGKILKETDIIRFEDIYGRIKK
jgi:mannose-1-phosphate guanylyltransferase/mannose-6-phosphate isomerase